MTQTIINNCLKFLLIRLIILTFIDAQDEILEGMIKDGENEIHLKWKKTEQLLANKYLPVWIANFQSRELNQENENTIKHKLMMNFIDENIGDFVFYHDIEKSSAIVYFKKSKHIYGVVDTRYIISELPLEECNLGHLAGGKYVKKNKGNIDYYTSHTKPLDLSIHGRNKEPMIQNIFSTSCRNEIDKYPNIHGNYHEVKTLYPEILLFVPYDMRKIIKAQDQNDYLAIIITHYIIYFNAIDMLFAKLSANNIKIHLNLAGIIIENEKNVFFFMKYYNTRHLDVVSTMNNIPEYLKKNSNTFPEDSFDFIFLSTNDVLWSSIINNYANGISGVGDIYTSRQTGTPYRKCAKMVVHFGHACEFVIAAHEIAHLMTIKHDPLHKGFYNHYMQCYSIMQEIGKYCSDCLKWSDESIIDFKNYARKDRNRCYLLNFPRSLHPYGHSMTTLSPSDQCHCYGFKPPHRICSKNHFNMIPETECNRNLICGLGPHAINTILPLDGTPCAHNKVCWNKICVSDTTKLT